MEEKIKQLNYYNAPRNCKECEGVMVYKGVGEYQCESCGYVDYDDYGKVRLYIEKHKGATASEVEQATGVPQRSIRKMLKESRIQIAEDSKIFLHCLICGQAIRSGEYCDECRKKGNANKKIEEKKEKQAKQGFGTGQNADEGQKRYMRNKGRR